MSEFKNALHRKTAADLAKKNAAPKGWEPSLEINFKGEGSITSDAVLTGAASPSFENLLASRQLDPTEYEVVGQVQLKSWQGFIKNADDEIETTTLHALRWRFQRIEEERTAEFTGKLDELFGILGATGVRKPKTSRKRKNRRALIVTLADLQIGKSDVLGGTKELLTRLASIQVQLKAQLEEGSYDRIVLVDGGDLVESFENTGAQAFTNDLSFPAQIRTGIAVVWSFVELLASYGKLTILSVNSNHCQWRSGRNNLGRTSDDFGLLVFGEVTERAKLLGLDVSLVVPDEHAEVAFESILGHDLAVVHGHQYNNPNSFQTWLKGQTAGGSRIVSAEVVLTGHFHHLRMEPAGRIPGGKQRWWMQLPALDGGSSWFTNRSGQSSDPGLVTFEMTEAHGFELSSIRVFQCEEELRRTT